MVERRAIRFCAKAQIGGAIHAPAEAACEHHAPMQAGGKGRTASATGRPAMSPGGLFRNLSRSRWPKFCLLAGGVLLGGEQSQAAREPLPEPFEETQAFAAAGAAGSLILPAGAPDRRTPRRRDSARWRKIRRPR
jgi:hypothetical protein